MCGIIGVVSDLPAEPILIEGLNRLQYRGYDAAGVASVGADGAIQVRKSAGKLEKLAVLLSEQSMSGTIGIGHTRWATHGVNVDRNAHPHLAGRVAVVHNGIVENFSGLRDELEKQGCKFVSETDTEVVPQLINLYLESGMEPLEAVRTAVLRLKGQSAIVCLFKDRHGLLIFACRGKSLVLGIGEQGTFIGSDELAFVGLADRVVYTKEEDIGVITRDGFQLYDVHGDKVTREKQKIRASLDDLSLGPYRHSTEKEIFEQPDRLGDTIRSLSDPDAHRIVLPKLPFDLGSVSRLHLVACGTAYYAGLVGEYWLESMGLPVECDVASEFRYRERDLDPSDGGIVISQSGDTEDTFEALKRLRETCKTLAIVNVAETRIPRLADTFIQTRAGGRERGVAATKSFTTQLIVLAAIAIETGRLRGRLTREREDELTQKLNLLPMQVQKLISRSDEFVSLAREIMYSRDVYFIGRGTSYCIALEGALKLKELSYIHAEGYTSGELKHGTIALIEPGVPVIAIAPTDRLFEKTASNVGLVTTKGGNVILLSDARGCAELGNSVWRTIEMPTVDPFFAPVLYAVAVQLLAYHTAVLKGTDVDQPRNLAKSVTVE